MEFFQHPWPVWHARLRRRVRVEEHPNSHLAQHLQTPAECDVPSQRVLDKGYGKDRNPKPRQLAQKPCRKGIGYACRPLIHRVERGRSYHDCVRKREVIRLAWHPEIRSNPIAGDFGELVSVDEPHAHRCGDNPDTPSGLLCEVHELSDTRCCRCGAHDLVEDPA